ncbi:hypothetical protein TrLO_g4003 [Triparma laevis f. longispina]|uniref:Uncharacterized protein n=1 Tax=Triparma laevis f. longispina TaxID=1714387 RepID=A0A9W7A5F3_9STRA|nr:hypothetical protein TrLO_g4003 [Triparma laevis f. longispina]
MAAPALNLEEYKKNYGCGIPSWSPLYHEPMPGEPTQSVNLVGGVLLPPGMRKIDQEAITFGLDVLAGKGPSRAKLGWSAQETAVGCRIRDYGSGVPHWSPLYGGSDWRNAELRGEKDYKPKFKDFKTGRINDKVSTDLTEEEKMGGEVEKK